jgi:uncharacterized protein YndB with AHSA1/START domain
MMTDATGARGRVIGSLRPADRNYAVHMEERYDTDIADLWSAITEPDRLARWLAQVDGDLELGGTAYARFTSGWEGDVTVDACDPPRRLKVTLAPGQADQTEIEVDLTADGGTTLLVMEERGIPIDEVAGYGAGWQAHLEDLATVLAGRERGPWSERWAELAPAYDALRRQLANGTAAGDSA